MYTQRQMGIAKREEAIANSRIKSMGLKNAYVTFIRGQGPGAYLVDRDAKVYEYPSGKEVVEPENTYDADLKKRQDANRKKEQKNERRV